MRCRAESLDYSELTIMFSPASAGFFITLEGHMTLNKFRREERRRLARDIELRGQIATTEEADDLLLRLRDTTEQIAFDLSNSEEFPPEDRAHEDIAEWKARARNAILRFEMIARQVQRRRDYLSGQDAQD